MVWMGRSGAAGSAHARSFFSICPWERLAFRADPPVADLRLDAVPVCLRGIPSAEGYGALEWELLYRLSSDPRNTGSIFFRPRIGAPGSMPDAGGRCDTAGLASEEKMNPPA